MKYVKAAVNGKEIYLQQQANGTWQVTDAAPEYSGVYPVVLTVTADNGISVSVGPGDKEFEKILNLIVTGESISGDRMLRYLPEILWPYLELCAIMSAEGTEVDRLLAAKKDIQSNALIMSALEERVCEWEKALGIVPAGTLEQRKTYILALMRGQGKLNEEKIKQVVNAFTGGAARVTFSDSVFDVKVLAPVAGDTYRFEDIKRALEPRVPAHLGLAVRKYYANWREIKDNFADWQAIRNMGSWGDVYGYIPPA